jgi:inner membrane protein
MLLFGHTGITLGAAVLLNSVLAKRHTAVAKTNTSREQAAPSPSLPTSRNSSSVSIVSWFTSLAGRIDIRLLLVGSLLPDIIDKPVGHFLFPDVFGTGRIFCHTLLFLILITLVGLCLYWTRNKTWLLVLSFGTFMHIILDVIWLDPRTFLWPLYGLTFERICLNTWIQDILCTLLKHPIVIIPELVGAIIIIWFVLILVCRRKLCTFIRYGKV